MSKKVKKRTNSLRSRKANRKNSNTECNFINQRNIYKLQRKIEETLRYKSSPEGNLVN